MIQSGKWQIRIRSEEPHLVENSEVLYEPDLMPPPIPVVQRAYTLVRRTSYMVGAPNREVWWAIDRWVWKNMSWETVVEGKSRLRKGAGPS